MREEKIDFFFESKAQYFERKELYDIEYDLVELPDDNFRLVAYRDYKDPTLVLIISVLFGGLGLDRFFLKQYGLGILKLITFGGFGFWYLYDLFVIYKATQKYNLKEYEEAFR